MAWRVWSKLCCSQKWILVICPLLLLFLTVFIMAITLPLPLPPSASDRRPSRALSSAGDFVRPRPGVAELPRAAFLEPAFHIPSSAWRAGAERETPKHPPLSKPFKRRSHASMQRNKHKSKGNFSKRTENIHPIQYREHHQPRLPQITVNSAEPQHRIMVSNHNSGVKLATYARHERSRSKAAPTPAATIISDRRVADRRASAWRHEPINRTAGRQIHANQTSAKLQALLHDVEKHRPATRRFGRFMDEGQQAANKPTLSLKKKSKSLERVETPKAAGPREEEGGWCQGLKDQDFPDRDRRRIRGNPDLPPWLSRDDVHKMEMLADGEVVSKANVPAHGQVLQVALEPPLYQQNATLMRGPGQPAAPPGHAAPHSEVCTRGRCCIVKRLEDWYEVFAFHLDRVLGLNRSLPAVLRTFRSGVLPYRYISGTPRPAVWWDPDIQHLTDQNNDQNSVPLSWVQYQQLLQAHCGSQTGLSSPPCVGVQHSEWGRLALFDFLLQVNDRLDRCCCGFTPDPTELCMENLLHAKCGDNKHMLLVHILVRTTDSSRLVFIDNAGRAQQSSDNLNFRLVEGIDEFPERAVSVLRSGCLESLLLRSLYTDRELWESRGGAGGLRPLVQLVQQRGDVLLQHIRDKELRLKSDL